MAGSCYRKIPCQGQGFGTKHSDWVVTQAPASAIVSDMEVPCDFHLGWREWNLPSRSSVVVTRCLGRHVQFRTAPELLPCLPVSPVRPARQAVRPR